MGGDPETHWGSQCSSWVPGGFAGGPSGSCGGVPGVCAPLPPPGLTPAPQVVLLSATMPLDVLEVTKKFMREPIRILVKKEELTLEGIRQFYINVEREVRGERDAGDTHTNRGDGALNPSMVHGFVGRPVAPPQ